MRLIGTGSCPIIARRPSLAGRHDHWRELRASEGRGLMGFRVSVDTGGTFTDVVVADEDGRLLLAKAPTDVTRAFQSIEEGLAQLAPMLGLTRRRAARPHGGLHLRHDPRDERDRRGHDGPHRVLHDGGLPRRPAAPRGREARPVPSGPVPAALCPAVADVRAPGADRFRGGRVRPARRGERPSGDLGGPRARGGGSRGMPPLVDRQP